MGTVSASALVSNPGGALLTRGQPSVSVAANCSSEFSWMNNGKGQSPCVVAAWEQEACADTTWFIPALSNNSYDHPNATTATACTCSWATYNLLAACTVCQNSLLYAPWGSWQMSCSAFVSDTTYFPSDKNFTLPSETAIPFWAATDPQIWSDANFNTIQAQGIANEGHADLTGAPISTASPKKSDTGAIVGGVVGGLAVIALIIVFFACGIVKKRKRLQQQKTYPGGPSRPNIQHMHTMSDSSQNALNPNGYGIPPGLQMSSVMQPHTTNGMPQMSHSMPNVSSPGPYPMSPVSHMPIITGRGALQTGGIVTHTAVSPTLPARGHMPSASVQSLGNAMSSIGFNAPQGGGSSGAMPLEEVISPFVTGQIPSQPAGWKAGGTTKTSQDFSEGGLPTSPTSPTSSAYPPRTRMNPPAYTAAPGSGEVQTLAPTSSERKYGYDTSSASRSNANLEENNLNGTGVGTGATFGSLVEVSPPELRWGGTTVAGSSEPAETVVGDDDSDAQRGRPLKDSL